MENTPAEQLLITRIRQGDAHAWEELIAQYEGRLLAFVHSRLQNTSHSEDVVQETFLGFLISLPNYDSSTPLESYLFAIAGHKLTDHFRRQGRRPEIPAWSTAASESSAGIPEPVGPNRRASSLLRSQERRGSESEVVRICLQHLIEQWKQGRNFERLMCAELLFVLGWPNKKVAAELMLTEQQVANHKQAVVQKLKQAARQARHHPEGLIGLE